jgi:hypothetical protein
MATSIGACNERILSKSRSIMRIVEGIVLERSNASVTTMQAHMALSTQLAAYQVPRRAVFMSPFTGPRCLSSGVVPEGLC